MDFSLFSTFDSALLSWLPPSPTLARAMEWVTFLGNWKLVVAAGALLALAWWARGHRNWTLRLAIALAGNQATVETLKLLFHRPRPTGAEALESSFSFPSGHAAVSVAFYGLIACFLWEKADSPSKKALIAMAVLPLIGGIGFSRLVLGVHFPSDVTAGFLVGIFWLWFSGKWKRPFGFEIHVPSAPPANPVPKTASRTL